MSGTTSIVYSLVYTTRSLSMHFSHASTMFHEGRQQATKACKQQQQQQQEEATTNTVHLRTPSRDRHRLPCEQLGNKKKNGELQLSCIIPQYDISAVVYLCSFCKTLLPRGPPTTHQAWSSSNNSNSKGLSTYRPLASASPYTLCEGRHIYMKPSKSGSGPTFPLSCYPAVTTS